MEYQPFIGACISHHTSQLSLVTNNSPSRIFQVSIFIFCLICLASCRQKSDSHKPTIGLLMETLKEERWQHDRDFFVAKASSLGCNVEVAACNNDDNLQIAQAENMLAKGVDILVVVPHNGDICATIVNKAHAQGVRVIAYDRLIRNCDLDLYISFDNVRVGEMQAAYIVERAPAGNYILMGGAKTDNNALLFRKGQTNVLQPYIESGKIKIIMDQWATDWQAGEAMKHVENALTKTTDIQAVVASNDATAAGCIQALTEKGLAGKVLVSGQDADIGGCRRVVAGTQSMTIYKPIQPLAETAVEAALQMINNTIVIKAARVINNGKIDVPGILLDPVAVDKDNMRETVIASGYQKSEDVYK
ncbi:MAG: substrate-binding domain-containing protein [Chitinophagales bacterium]